MGACVREFDDIREMQICIDECVMRMALGSMSKHDDDDDRRRNTTVDGDESDMGAVADKCTTSAVLLSYTGTGIQPTRR